MLQTQRANVPMLEGTIDRLAGTMATSDEIGKNQPNAAFSPWLMLPRRERDNQDEIPDGRHATCESQG